MTALSLPLLDQPALPWSFLVLEAARGGVAVPDWLFLAVPGVVGEVLGMPAEEVQGAHVDQALLRLPDSPLALLWGLLMAVDEELPRPGAALRLDHEAVVGSFREAVPLVDLLHDAAVIVQQSYGADGFFDCMASLEDPDSWDARGAVAAGMYLMLLYGAR